MATIESAIGPRLDLDGPPPRPPRHSLLQTEGVVVERSGGRWLNGVNVIGYPDDVPSTWEPCSDGTFRVKSEGTARPQALFDPFVAYLPVTCSTFGWEDLQAQAEAVLEATVSMAVERVLAEGLVVGANPFFGDANVVILGGGAVIPQTALSYLENAIGETGRGGMIHGSPAVLAGLQGFPAERGQESPLRTINGTPLVSGGGYIDVTTTALSNPAVGQDWAFATGPVEVRLGPLSVQDIRTSLDRSDNVVTFRAEQYVLATWDTALQAAVLVDWST